MTTPPQQIPDFDAASQRALDQQCIDLSIVEPLGVERPRWPWTLGIPFPQGCLTSHDRQSYLPQSR